jgi:hypothetical protein
LVPTQGLFEHVLVAASATPLSAITPNKVIAKISSARVLIMERSPFLSAAMGRQQPKG